MTQNILVVVDMQNDFITGSLANKSAEAIIPNIIREISSGKYDRIIFTQDTHYDNYLKTQEGKKLPVPHCIEGTWGWKVCDELLEEAANNLDKIEFLTKPVFAYGDWANWLTQHGIKLSASFTFTGTCTDICVASNAAALRGACPEADITCIADCCAPFGLTPEQQEKNQEAALTVMANQQVTVIR